MYKITSIKNKCKVCQIILNLLKGWIIPIFEKQDVVEFASIVIILSEIFKFSTVIFVLKMLYDLDNFEKNYPLNLDFLETSSDTLVHIGSLIVLS